MIKMVCLVLISHNFVSLFSRYYRRSINLTYIIIKNLHKEIETKFMEVHASLFSNLNYDEFIIDLVVIVSTFLASSQLSH
jgi:hypothetical protein